MASTKTLTGERGAPQAEAVRQPTPFAVRIGLGVALAGVVALLIGLDSVWPAGYVYAAAGTAVVLLTLVEYARLAARLEVPVQAGFLALSGATLFLAQWAGWSWPGTFPEPGLSAVAVLSVATVALLIGRVLRAQIDGALESIAVHGLALVHVPVLLGFLSAVRAGWGTAGLALVLAVCKAGAIGAYVVGKHAGRRPLARVISPRKTVEGAVGAVLASVLVAVGLSLTRWAVMGPLWAVLFGVVVAVASMLGDLAVSLLKRQAGLKDSGNLLRGFGGMLDMLDDVLFGAPAAYFVLCGLAAFGVQG